jgi:Ca2+:H+ antiporter
MRRDDLRPNPTGVSAYLSLLVVLSAVAFAMPGLIGEGGAYLPGQEIPVIALTVALYAFFLFRQTGRQRADFQEVPQAPSPARDGSAHRPAGRPSSPARDETLIVTVTPIVLLSHDMAALLDDGLGRLGAPVALSGILIAMIVFLPETITAVRAAHAGEIQRVSNLCHGALVSTVGLTIPAVLLIGMLTDQTVVLAESPANLVLLAVTLLLSVATFAGRRTTALHGAAHLMVFAVYAIAVFS